MLSSLYFPPCAPPPLPAYKVNNTKKVTESGKIVIVPISLCLAKSKMCLNGGEGRGQSWGRQRKSARQNKAWLTLIFDNKRANKDPHLLDRKQLLKPHTQVALSSCFKWGTPDSKAALARTCAQQWSSEDYWTCRPQFLYVFPKIFPPICLTWRPSVSHTQPPCVVSSKWYPEPATDSTIGQPKEKMNSNVENPILTSDCSTISNAKKKIIK